MRRWSAAAVNAQVVKQNKFVDNLTQVTIYREWCHVNNKMNQNCMKRVMDWFLGKKRLNIRVEILNTCIKDLIAERNPNRGRSRGRFDKIHYIQGKGDK